jgi:hypothetical protein
VGTISLAVLLIMIIALASRIQWAHCSISDLQKPNTYVVAGKRSDKKELDEKSPCHKKESHDGSYRMRRGVCKGGVVTVRMGSGPYTCYHCSRRSLRCFFFHFAASRGKCNDMDKRNKLISLPRQVGLFLCCYHSVNRPCSELSFFCLQTCRPDTEMEKTRRAHSLRIILLSPSRCHGIWRVRALVVLVDPDNNNNSNNYSNNNQAPPPGFLT